MYTRVVGKIAVYDTVHILHELGLLVAAPGVLAGHGLVCAPGLGLGRLIRLLFIYEPLLSHSERGMLHLSMRYAGLFAEAAIEFPVESRRDSDYFEPSDDDELDGAETPCGCPRTQTLTCRSLHPTHLIPTNMVKARPRGPFS